MYVIRTENHCFDGEDGLKKHLLIRCEGRHVSEIRRDGIDLKEKKRKKLHLLFW